MGTDSTDGDIELIADVKQTIADGVVVVHLRRADGGPLPNWSPGAHVELLMPDGVVRQYSLCGDDADPSTYRIAVLREPNGRGSAWVHDELMQGTRVLARGPRNHFEFADAPNYLFVAGGIGITPLLPMMARAAALGAPWRLLYGGRTRSSMAFRDELVAQYGDRVQVRPEDEFGLLDLETFLAAASPGTAVYCCGPDALIGAAKARAAAREGVTFYAERFTTHEDSRPGDGFDVECARSGITLHVPAGRSILEVAEEAGLPVISSCRSGTCATCETPVLAGVVDHRDFILTDDERDANDTMMICVSRAADGKLVLDL